MAILGYIGSRLTKIQDDHKEIIISLLNEIYDDQTSQNIYTYFTHRHHHGTPIYLCDELRETGINVEIDDNMLLNKYVPKEPSHAEAQTQTQSQRQSELNRVLQSLEQPQELLEVDSSSSPSPNPNTII